MEKKKKLTKAERKEARLQKGKQWLLIYRLTEKDEQALLRTLSCGCRECR